jgi:hypothetical protein
VVNVQHNCADHGCKLENTSVILQEREKTVERGLAVQHVPKNDFVLNTSQMRNSEIVRCFGGSPEPLDRTKVIFDSVTNEFDALKPKHVPASSKKKGKMIAMAKGVSRIPPAPYPVPGPWSSLPDRQAPQSHRFAPYPIPQQAASGFSPSGSSSSVLSHAQAYEQPAGLYSQYHSSLCRRQI